MRVATNVLWACCRQQAVCRYFMDAPSMSEKLGWQFASAYCKPFPRCPWLAGTGSSSRLTRRWMHVLNVACSQKDTRVRRLNDTASYTCSIQSLDFMPSRKQYGGGQTANR